ncbi:MAG TPA: PAS domain-containing protein [Hyphomicrobium sp.]|nr:PAS domain-containing protein [Hyphomicrobium sp.]HRO50328.1 PAS domain-containing protein [Hyphomicrobium sp.]
MQPDAHIQHRASRSLYAYWNALRAGRRAPRRLEIQPAQLGGLLLDTFILERTDRSTFLFRLAGTRVSGWLGADLRTRNFLSCWGEADRAMLERHLSAISELGRVGLFTGEGYPSAGPAPVHSRAAGAPFELIVLPLMHTGQTIDRLLCLLVSLDETVPDTLRPFHGLKLLAAEEIWPEGVSSDPFALTDPPPALHPNVRMARIVRQGRRQFRVYQGGRVGDAQDAQVEAERP